MLELTFLPDRWVTIKGTNGLVKLLWAMENRFCRAFLNEERHRLYRRSCLHWNLYRVNPNIQVIYTQNFGKHKHVMYSWSTQWQFTEFICTPNYYACKQQFAYDSPILYRVCQTRVRVKWILRPTLENFSNNLKIIFMLLTYSTYWKCKVSYTDRTGLHSPKCCYSHS